MAHKLTGDDRGFSSFEALSPRPEGPSCACLHRQHIGGLLHKLLGKSVVASTLQRGTSDPSDPLLYENTLLI